jgi:protein gp37
MAENSKIEWTDHTFNPWVGCTKVSAACDHCYAESWAKRTGQPGLWAGERRRTSESNWRQPIKWNRQAEAEGVRKRVFCASLADVFDNQVHDAWRADLFQLIEETPSLDWQLLTKRPQNARKMLNPLGGTRVLPNVWIGTTAENQVEYWRRWNHLSVVPARIRFISYEPALGPLGDLRLSGTLPRPDWFICGGESGPGARPMHPTWAREVRDQCAAAGVPFFFKQWGEWVEADGSVIRLNDVGMRCIGKKAAGRLLDGRTHDAMPQVPA